MAYALRLPSNGLHSYGGDFPSPHPTVEAAGSVLPLPPPE